MLRDCPTETYLPMLKTTTEFSEKKLGKTLATMKNPYYVCTRITEEILTNSY
jgi:hypothetical protein